MAYEAYSESAKDRDENRKRKKATNRGSECNRREAIIVVAEIE